MWSRYDARNEAGVETTRELFAASKEHGHRFLLFSIDSDFCFYPEEQATLIKHMEDAGTNAMHINVNLKALLIENALHY